jgi:hypothetical protein
MKRNLLVTVLVVCIALVFAVCGGEADKPAADQPKEEQQAAKAADPGEGVAVAKEILETFDKAVAEVAELVKDKPAPAELKPKVEALLKKYEEPMKALNVKYLALKEKDIKLFGDCNGYLGENRGKHVINKDTVLDQFIYHYSQQEEGGAEIVQLIQKDIVNLLEIAVKR